MGRIYRACPDTRSIALNMLIRINEDGFFSHLVMRETLAKLNHYESRDKALIKRLTEGTLEQQIQIDYIIDQFSKIPVVKMKPLIRNLLRISVYQIIFMTNIPDRAACDEAVKLAGKRGFSSLKGFINGILRNIIRQKNDLKLPDEVDEQVKFLSINFSMPEWLVEKWLNEFDYDSVKLMLKGLIDTKPVTVRLHRKYSGKQQEEWIKQIKSTDAEICPHPYLDYAYEIRNMDNIFDLPGFKEGFFIVQDVSSMLVCEAAEIKASDVVVDICAAPGGKALHAAERALKVFARDINEYKCKMIQENAVRLKQDNLEISVHDAAVLDESLIKKADIVLADLPCSGLGIIGKKPDIKYKVSKESLNNVCELQRFILSIAWQYVKPGGSLVYSTCTINQDENENMMTWFTRNFPFTYEKLPEKLSNLMKGISKNQQQKTGMLKLLPGFHQTDGFFICRLRRKEL